VAICDVQRANTSAHIDPICDTGAGRRFPDLVGDGALSGELHPVRPARHRVRTLDGAAAWDQLERRAWLDLMEAAGWVVEIEHRNRPS
jgi:hypothetical protein